jgi:hypothetical protein
MMDCGLESHSTRLLRKAWGFASEMGRHIREGRQPDRKEAELIVGLAVTISTY